MSCIKQSTQSQLASYVAGFRELLKKSCSLLSKTWAANCTRVVELSSGENPHVHVAGHPSNCWSRTPTQVYRPNTDTQHNIIPISLARGVKIINYSHQKRMDFSSCLAGRRIQTDIRLLNASGDMLECNPRLTSETPCLYTGYGRL